MNPNTKPKLLDPADFQATPDEWCFPVMSYQINITNMDASQPVNYAAGILITDNTAGATGHFERHAVLQFYWDASSIPSPGGPTKSGLLHLNYSVAEYAGVLDLLKSSAPLHCYFKPGENYGGIVHPSPIPR